MKRPAFRMPRSTRWVPGNQFELLENGEEFFPRVFDAIAQARREVMLETFILFDDKIGKELHAALLVAAQRGVEVHVLVDGFGSPDLSDAFVGSLVEAGVRFRIFDPGRPFMGQRLNVLRRMHRKIVVVDGELGFIGGINYSADHVADFGPEAKQDYAVQVRGPIVAQMHRFTREAVLDRTGRKRRSAAAATGQPHAGTAHAMFVTRDNQQHTNDIERHYRVALRAARSRVVIANAYFFPGYRFIREMRRAAKRGVDVRLILQGQPDMAIVKTAAGLLYDHLQRAGVRIYEYCDRPLHGKVALVDEDWSTVGSSNLDPLSLSLNLEANVIIKDRAFNQHLGEHLEQLMQNSCTQVQARDVAETGLWVSVRSFFVFHLLRRYPAWFGWLPAHTQRLTLAEKLLGRTDVDVKISHVNEGRVS
ncbi:MAG: cardiolipin synthase ClsB [Polaromonas sp.]|uniref:cardiolipin synthase ClsB n=1 Tax=Polaromonas sp. TaxID=1869339 RepID=UPI002733E272|nr:cardiolipin synthase ClsB [Polaromonas sp.]MDP3248665.1 cardiolipin synthase ClsB [Polaromonas sp.]